MGLQNPRDDRPAPVQRGYEGGGRSNGGVSMMRVLLLSVCAVVVSLVAVSYFLTPNLVSKTDFTKNFQAVTDALAKNKTDVAQTVASLQATVSALPNTVSSQVNTAINQSTSTMTNSINSIQTQVNNMASIVKDVASKSDITNLNNTITGLNSKITDLQTKSATDATAITALTTRIQVLEAGGAGATTPSISKKILVAIKSLGNNSLYEVDNLIASGASGADGIADGLSGAIRLTLTNTTTVDIKDINLDVQFSIYPNVPSYTPSMSGGGVPWTREYQDSSNVEFYNGAWGLSVPAGQSINLSLNLLLQGVNNALYHSQSYYFQVQASAQ